MARPNPRYLVTAERMAIPPPFDGKTNSIKHLTIRQRFYVKFITQNRLQPPFFI